MVMIQDGHQTSVCIDRLKISLSLVFELCHPSVAMVMIQDGHQTSVCIDRLKVSLKLVFELCHPLVAMETVQDARQTKKYISEWHLKYGTYSRFV